jgi:hypothetical protein
MSLVDKITRFETDVDLVRQIVQGGPLDIVTTEGGPVRALAKLIADKDAEIDVSTTAFLATKDTQINVAAGGILSQTQTLHDQTQTIHDQTDTIKTDTQQLKTDTQDLHDTTLTARDVTTGARDVTTTARDVTLGYRDATLTARDLTLGYRDTANTAASTTTTARDVTLGYRDTANTASGTATTQAGIATTQAGISTTQAGIATTQAGISATQSSAAATALLSAQVAAAQAQAFATASASAIQQDLSGVAAAALHRSPNAVTAMFIYNTANDSDGGAWVERTQATSWFNEALNSTWRGACATEAACRAISGATTGDYFQLTTDGKFYSLNVTSGITEVFRGNTAKFPRLAAIIAEATNVTLYDLTAPGWPMAFGWAAAANNMVQGTVSSLAAMNGCICVGSNSGAFIINMAKDSASSQSTSTDKVYKGNVAQRGGANGYL